MHNYSDGRDRLAAVSYFSRILTRSLGAQSPYRMKISSTASAAGAAKPAFYYLSSYFESLKIRAGHGGKRSVRSAHSNLIFCVAKSDDFGHNDGRVTVNDTLPMSRIAFAPGVRCDALPSGEIFGLPDEHHAAHGLAIRSDCATNAFRVAHYVVAELTTTSQPCEQSSDRVVLSVLSVLF